MKQFNNEITVSAPGKLMLLGEHSVVYGYPAIVTAMNTRIFAAAEKSDSDEDKYIASQVKECKFVKKAVNLFKKEYKAASPVKITTNGSFSHQVGLGSSSAVTVAAVKALSLLFKKSLTDKEVFDLSYRVTIAIQGVGSGFDIAAAAFGRTLYYVYGGRVIEPLKTDKLPLVVGYSGVKADTPTLIHQVRKTYDNDKTKVEGIFKNITNLVHQAEKAILGKNYKQLGLLMTENHKLLQNLGVSTKKLNSMVDASLKAGAYGAKLSGAGAGDCMIALVASEKRKAVEHALAKIGGTIINVENNAQGARRE